MGRQFTGGAVGDEDSVPAGRRRKIVDALKQSGAATIEAWITPKNDSQNGPARIVSLSNDSGLRNFTLGQERDHYHIRFRTTSTSKNGIPETDSGGGTAAPRLTHIVYTRDQPAMPACT